MRAARILAELHPLISQEGEHVEEVDQRLHLRGGGGNGVWHVLSGEEFEEVVEEDSVPQVLFIDHYEPSLLKDSVCPCYEIVFLRQDVHVALDFGDEYARRVTLNTSSYWSVRCILCLPPFPVNSFALQTETVFFFSVCNSIFGKGLSSPFSAWNDLARRILQIIGGIG